MAAIVLSLGGGGMYFLRDRDMAMSTRIMNLRLFSQGVSLFVAIGCLMTAASIGASKER